MNKKGISIIALIITVIVIIIIAGVTITQGTEIIRKTNIQNINTNMLLIQSKVSTLREHNIFNSDEYKLAGTKIDPNSETDAQIQKLLQEEIITPDYYKWNQETLDEVGLSSIILEDGAYFLIEYDSEDVVFSNGIKDSNNNVKYSIKDTFNLN